MSWIQSYTGKQIFPLEPERNEYDIEDIAHALSMTCRFNGHCKEFYSVGLHSLYVLELVSEHTSSAKTLMAALLHDASEAYISDLSRPVKGAIQDYKIIENRLQFAIYNHFIPDYCDNSIGMDIIKDADNFALKQEQAYLMNLSIYKWEDIPVNRDFKLTLPDYFRRYNGIPDMTEVKNDFIDECDSMLIDMHINEEEMSYINE